MEIFLKEYIGMIYLLLKVLMLMKGKVFLARIENLSLRKDRLIRLAGYVRVG